MHRVLPPSEPPDGERPRFFRLVVVGGTQLRGSWYLSAIARLQGREQYRSVDNINSKQEIYILHDYIFINLNLPLQGLPNQKLR
jgi:hypothetical protein